MPSGKLPQPLLESEEMKKFLFVFAIVEAVVGGVSCDRLPQLGGAADGKLATASQESCGYVQNSYGQRVSWKSSLPVKVYVDPSFPEEYMPVLSAAAAEWELKLHRTLFVFERAAETSTPAWDGRNTLYWLTHWDNPNRYLEGLTSLNWYRNQIVEGDIRINAEDYAYFVADPGSNRQLHLESLLVHELGHLLGLKHLDSESVMLITLDYGVKRDEPTEVDQANIRCEYSGGVL